MIVQATAPSNPVPGMQWHCTVDNITYTYDGARSKFLSSPLVMQFGLDGTIAATSYLEQVGGIDSGIAGLDIIHNATIIGISVGLQVGGSYTLTVEARTAVALITSINIVNDDHGIDLTLNADLSAADHLRARAVRTAGAFDDPEANIYVCWRRS